MADDTSPSPPSPEEAASAPERVDLVERVLSGTDPKLTRLAAEGLLAIPPEDARSRSRCGWPAATTRRSPASRRARWRACSDRVSGLIRHGAPVEVLTWFGREPANPEVLEAVLRRRDVPRELLPDLAARVSREPPGGAPAAPGRDPPAAGDPGRAGAQSRDLSAYSRRRIGEIRAHLLRRGSEPEPAERPERPDDEPSDEEVLEAIEGRARRSPPPSRPGVRGRDQQTGLSDIQIRLLPIPVRRKLARGRLEDAARHPDPRPQPPGGGGGARRRGPLRRRGGADRRQPLGGGGCARGDRPPPGLGEQAKIVSALVHNPRTPAGVAIRLLPRMSPRELGSPRARPQHVERRADPGRPLV